MPRLIDADALKIEVALLHGADYKTIHYLNHAPTVDAVPVIRCKDCKYYQTKGRNADDWQWCMMNHHYTDEEKYCAWAERKEE